MTPMERDLQLGGGDPPDGAPGDGSIPLARPIEFNSPATPDSEIHLLSISRAGAWSDILIFILLFVSLDAIVQVLVARLLKWHTGAEWDTDDVARVQTHRALLIPMLLWRAALAVSVIGYIVRRRGGNLRSVGVSSRNPALDLLIGVGAAIATGVATWTVVLSLAYMFPAFAEQLQENSGRIMERVPKASPATFAMMTLLIGLYEELIFRGFLMPRLRRAIGSWTAAVLLSTALFAALHMFDQVAAALVLVTILSVMFSVVTIWRRSIVPAIVAHALFDLAMFLQLYYLAGDQWK